MSKTTVWVVTDHSDNQIIGLYATREDAVDGAWAHWEAEVGEGFECVLPELDDEGCARAYKISSVPGGKKNIPFHFHDLREPCTTRSQYAYARSGGHVLGPLSSAYTISEAPVLDATTAPYEGGPEPHRDDAEDASDMSVDVHMLLTSLRQRRAQVEALTGKPMRGSAEADLEHALFTGITPQTIILGYTGAPNE